MAHVSCRDLMTRPFDCGMQSVVPVSTPSKGIPVGFIQSHSPQMAHVSCRDLMTTPFDCGMQSAAPSFILALLRQLHSLITSAPLPDLVTTISNKEIQLVVCSYQLTTLALVFILHSTDPKDNMHYCIKDGWIYCLPSYQRLCWIPVKSRGKLAWSGNCVALGTPDGRVVILDFSGILV